MDTPEALSAAQHRALLRYLCDECLDGETLRAALQLRIDATEEVRKEMRVTYAHFRSGIKARDFPCCSGPQGPCSPIFPEQGRFCGHGTSFGHQEMRVNLRLE